MPRRGLEPPRFYPLVPETSASTNSATWAFGAAHSGHCEAACQRPAPRTSRARRVPLPSEDEQTFQQARRWPWKGSRQCRRRQGGGKQGRLPQGSGTGRKPPRQGRRPATRPRRAPEKRPRNDRGAIARPFRARVPPKTATVRCAPHPVPLCVSFSGPLMNTPNTRRFNVAVVGATGAAGPVSTATAALAGRFVHASMVTAAAVDAAWRAWR